MSNEQKIASFYDACEAVARKHRFERFAEMEPHYDGMNLVYKQAAELYAESKARDAWERACEAQKHVCVDEIEKVEAQTKSGKIPGMCSSGNVTVLYINAIIEVPKPEYKP